MCYNRVISLGGRVNLFSLTDSMLSMCMAMIRHSSRPWNTHEHRHTAMKRETECRAISSEISLTDCIQ